MEQLDKNIQVTVKNDQAALNKLPSLDPANIEDCFDLLKKQTLVNLNDTFSRFVFTTDYKEYVKAVEAQKRITIEMVAVYGDV